MLAKILLLCTDGLLDRGSWHEDLYLLLAEAVLSGAILVDEVGIAHDRSTILKGPVNRYAHHRIGGRVAYVYGYGTQLQSLIVGESCQLSSGVRWRRRYAASLR
jgi:hypothetical protein